MTDEQLETWKRERMATITKSLREMSHERLVYYTREIALQIIIAAADIGDTDWPEDLHLGDFLEKHMLRHIPRDAAGAGEDGE